jgi:hypothetical protein
MAIRKAKLLIPPPGKNFLLHWIGGLLARMVRAERFELPAFWFVARRSIQLSYARMCLLKDYQTG